MKIQAFIEQCMGRQVRFTHRLVFRSSRDGHGRLNYYWTPQPLTGSRDVTIGWVVGFRNLPHGYLVLGDWEDGGRRFQSEGKATPAFLVVTYPTLKPIRVPPDSVEVLSEPVPVRMWRDEDRRMLSEESKEWPRDERGRFRKGV